MKTEQYKLLAGIKCISGSIKILLVFLIALVFSITSCKDDSVAVDETDQGGVGIIVPGSSVDGVKLGDSRETVIEKLGNPASAGYADGTRRSWRFYEYDEGTHAGIYILFIDMGSSFGPVDGIGMYPEYTGKTREGIGIGSSITEVHQVYGSPDTTFIRPGSSVIADYYCINGKKLEIHYEDSLVSRLFTGYFIPMPEDPLNPCN